MNKIFLIIFLITYVLIGDIYAQLPNTNFEHWTKSVNNRDSLIGWSSSNSVVLYPVNSLYKDEDSYEGQYAGNLDTAPFGFVGYSTIGILVNGVASFSYGGGGGGANVEYLSGGGSPLSYKPTELRGYYKYSTLSPPDEGYAKVLLSKYNAVLNKRDTISYTTHIFPEVEEYTAFSISLPDLKPGILPDTITTFFYSSNPATLTQLGVFSNLFLDGISLFPFATSTDNLPNEGDGVSIYPNPNNGIFYIQKRDNKIETVSIYNSMGQLLKSINLSVNDDVSLIDLSDYASGVYFLIINDMNSLAKKLVVLK
ncbi:MAG TPA: T9SS type A sorting domain-containing protein [Saprospiraceae bacterium]|nr:T9SS type A sorting domain-containing protein [Saprospiraceae bacterium]